MARHFLRQHHAMPGRPDEPSPAELAARSPARAGQHSGSSHGCMARARRTSPPPPPAAVAPANPSVGGPLSCELRPALPWRPTSSGTRRRGDFCVLNEIPSARARVWNSDLAFRRSDIARVFPEIQPLDRRFLRSVAISFRGANFVSLYLLHRSSVWRATSSGAKLDSVASVGPLYTYQLFRLLRRIAWRCLLA
ncbi:putative formin-like protein 18 isoform X1 [Iris pallida]|uniref:Formin-like protein 18 isoform X1 n=1 Tax=Iris pallida TaxID=29817 RepID=A0AAX6DQ06_IRIPA|nr:putative formin-like protein 18 isoform X1 [Iris pallida]